MMKPLSRSTPIALTALLALTVGAPQLAAQEEEVAPTCTATADPAELDAGSAATSLSITLSEPVGPVEQFQAAVESGLRTADPEDLPRVEMAQEEEEAPRPIEMAAEGNSLTLWLNSEDAEAGVHEFTLIGPEGECTGTVTVRPIG